MAAGIITSAVSGAASTIVGALDGLFTSDDERNKAQIEMQRILQEPQIQQALANIESAKSSSVFVAGARPAILWVCAAGLAWAFVLQPILASILVMAGHAEQLPVLDVDYILSLTGAVLGMAGWRSWDKRNGVAREAL